MVLYNAQRIEEDEAGRRRVALSCSSGTELIDTDRVTPIRGDSV